MAEIPRPDKILLAMFALSDGTSQPLEYEDIVVRAWELFPEDFGLRKYVTKHPDSSDIHKPLYGPLKDRGMVLSGNKKFKLTEAGIAHAASLESERQGSNLPAKSNERSVKVDRLSRSTEAELKRICETDAFKLFAAGQKEKILDTDFYAFLAATVRTEKHEFLGRLKIVTKATEEATAVSVNPKHRIAVELHKFVCEKFTQIIQRKQDKP